jgi:hypothetical protein
MLMWAVVLVAVVAVAQSQHTYSYTFIANALVGNFHNAPSGCAVVSCTARRATPYPNCQALVPESGATSLMSGCPSPAFLFSYNVSLFIASSTDFAFGVRPLTNATCDSMDWSAPWNCSGYKDSETVLGALMRNPCQTDLIDALCLMFPPAKRVEVAPARRRISVR